ncbi:MAG TPA: pyruvate dehydrogenase (acetyl-transferring) E1 component subunit alpha [Candidatus Krumholzibacteria bacterium]|nr:pyruvate dehydrogenase (acetyl-transferring) E1 component subunit alpha [Candidatus Krumholzibacteria bacterium]HPD70751.1 pyruvate dehydrogenase (acetyl-transferring) E1 component subunit alpha [Candidatus Krumholzibacteria bacterium]HRY39549.1 pyruvate dehydrogenase (acetyl-transferring) E1 component subunit alpha [Candidatus Krumholzibacteria bacterium]
MPRKTLAEFTVEFLQILDEDGNFDADLEPDLPPAELLRLYRGMVRARELDQRMLKLQRQGRIGTFGPCTGQEAPSAAAALAMQKDDWFVGAFRELSGRLLRGEPLTNPLYYYNGWEEGNVQPPEVGRRMLPLAVVVASQVPQAAGLGYAVKYRGEQSAVVCFLGDGATSEGDFHEGLNFAAVWQAPVVFVSQNNQWAISIPRAQQTRSRTLAQKGIAYEIPCLQVDGNDPLACYAAIKEGLDRARAGGGPTLIEAVTYRLLMHTTADDPRKYRDEAEEQEWWRKEPLLRFRKYLEAKRLWDEARENALRDEVRAEVDAAVATFEETAPWPPDRPFEHVFARSEPHLDQQRREFLAGLKEDADA